MVIDNAVPRVSQALADFANDEKIDGLSTWDPSDFGAAAKQFVTAAVKLASKDTPSDAMGTRLVWELTGWRFDTGVLTQHQDAIDVALFEIGPDLFPGVEF